MLLLLLLLLLPLLLAHLLPPNAVAAVNGWTPSCKAATCTPV
jgi:hypothetical protein